MIFIGVAVMALLTPAQGAPSPSSPPRVGWDGKNEIPVIPQEFRSVIANAAPEKMMVRSLDGRIIPVDIAGYNVWDYRLYQRGRYLGMRLSGYEVVGYLLIDRAARTNNVIATGSQPLFSNDGRWFAVAGITDADQGNFEGLGLWEVHPTDTVRRFFTDAVPLSSDWRTDRWIGSCVAFSAFTSAGSGYYPSEEPKSRHNYGLWVGPDITLQQSGSEPPCNEAKRL